MKSSGSNSSSNGNGGEGSSSKMERKTIEKQRRMQMKSLCFKLASLIRKQPPYLSISSKEGGTQVDNLEEAASYIIKLRNRIEKLREMKMRRMHLEIKEEEPIIQVRYHHPNPNLEVLLIINTNTNTNTSRLCCYHKVIRIIEEELGADVVNASLSSLPDKLVYTIHSQIRNPRGGLDASRVSNRLRQLMDLQLQV